MPNYSDHDLRTGHLITPEGYMILEPIEGDTGDGFMCDCPECISDESSVINDRARDVLSEPVHDDVDHSLEAADEDQNETTNVDSTEEDSSMPMLISRNEVTKPIRCLSKRPRLESSSESSCSDGSDMMLD